MAGHPQRLFLFSPTVISTSVCSAGVVIRSVAGGFPEYHSTASAPLRRLVMWRIGPQDRSESGLQAFIGWFLVVSLGATAVVASIDLPTRWESERTKAYRAGAVAILGSVVGLVLLALVWKVRRVADLDASVVTLLATKRSHGVTAVMNVVTTIGDPIPSFTIAAVLAIMIYQRGRHRILPLLLPLAVVIELFVQILITDIFHDVTIAQLRSGLPLGGAGTIPSGSVARLFCIFSIAAQLWVPRGIRSRGVMTIGAALVTIQLISRLYLGRHLLADILGGLLLGIILERLAYLLLSRRGQAPAGASPETASPEKARR